MATRFDDWEGDFLAHHGIKGQRWGIRRYQNEDGTLTELGKARVARGNVSYMNPSRKDVRKGRAAERIKVGNKYVDEYVEATRRQGREMDPKPATANKIWNKYKDEYASAVLKDLKLRDLQRGRDSVKAIFASIDPSYNYGASRKWTYDTWEQASRYAAERHKEMAHPVRTKIRKGVKKLIKAGK